MSVNTQVFDQKKLIGWRDILLEPLNLKELYPVSFAKHPLALPKAPMNPIDQALQSLQSSLQLHSMPPHRPPSNLARPSALIWSHHTRHIPRSRPSAVRTLASTHPPDVSEHPSPDTASHESHYDPPSGWLFGVPPGQKYQKEGWENTWVYGFWGSLVLGVVAYAYKPDTS